MKDMVPVSLRVIFRAPFSIEYVAAFGRAARKMLDSESAEHWASVVGPSAIVRLAAEVVYVPLETPLKL